MRRALLAAFCVVVLATALGATVFREEIAAAAQNLNVFVTNDATNPVPATVVNTPLAVDAGFETKVLLDRVMTGGEDATISVAAYKTVHVDWTLQNGTCFGSGAALSIIENTGFTRRGFIPANDACVGDFTGETLEIPGRSLKFILAAPAGDTWRVIVFGRAN